MKSCIKTDAGTDGCSVPRLMIAAPGSGSGKTLITCGLLRLLQRKGFHPAAFKCGPDYIDPMFHRQVLGIPSRNLDTFFLPGEDGNSVREILARAVAVNKADIAVIEGVMGYFDGTGESGMQASSFDLAVQTETPVILAVDAKGMSRSVVPLLKGISEYEQPAGQELSGGVGNGVKAGQMIRVRGVILNRISPGMFPLMKKWIEQDTGLQVIGYVPQDDGITWGSRHLGLLQPEEISGLQVQIDHLADRMEETIDLEQLLEIACKTRGGPSFCSPLKTKGRPLFSMLSVAVARDEAFNFYYEDNLELLHEYGAEIVYFSPLHDKTIPDADGLLLGGGYPELYAQALAENEEMKTQIRACAAEGMPILAECGGFMYLQEYLEVGGARYKMCGVLPGTCRMTDRLVRFGYIELEKKDKEAGTAGYISGGHRIRGHEFHYFDSTDNGDACTAYKPGRKRSWDCMVVQGKIMAGFPHLYYRSDPEFAGNFVKACAEFHSEK